MNDQERLSRRVCAVVDALNLVQEIREECLDVEPVPFYVFQHRETKKFGVLIPQGDDPENALILDDNGLSGMQKGSMCLPWEEDGGEAFFAAVITAFMCHKEILQPPVCEECATSEVNS